MQTIPICRTVQRLTQIIDSSSLYKMMINYSRGLEVGAEVFNLEKEVLELRSQGVRFRERLNMEACK